MISPTSFKQKLKSSLTLSGCLHKCHRCHRHHFPPDTKPTTGIVRTLSNTWVKTYHHHQHHDLPEIKDPCRHFMSRLSGSKHARRHSADFRYDALSYARNFDDQSLDENPLRNFTSRLPPSPPPPPPQNCSCN